MDEKQFDSDASQNRKPDGKLFILLSSTSSFYSEYFTFWLINTPFFIRQKMCVFAAADKIMSTHRKRATKSSQMKWEKKSSKIYFMANGPDQIYKH